MQDKKIKIMKINSIGSIFILLMLIVILQSMNIVPFYYLTTYIVAIFWIILVSFSCSNKNIKNSVTKFSRVIVLFAVPWLVFILDNIFLYISGIAKNDYLKSSFIQIMFMPITIMFALSLCITFKNKTSRYLIYSFIIGYIMIVVYSFSMGGPLVVINTIINLLTGDEGINYFEVSSDLIYALGIFFVYYLFNKNVSELKDVKESKHLCFVLIFIFLGLKRIQILAMIAVIVTSLIFKIFSYKRRLIQIIQNVVCMLFGIFAFFYVSLIQNHELSLFLWKQGINTMGRIQMYDYMANYFDFSNKYLGQGYNFSNFTLVNSGYTYTLHNDVLKVFIDLGFWIFLFWIVYSLFIQRFIIYKKYGKKAEMIYFLMTVYMFVLYFTDNAINYFITQTTYIVLVTMSVTKNNKYGKESLRRYNYDEEGIYKCGQ